jgi:signal transduction histidine kinase
MFEHVKSFAGGAARRAWISVGAPILGLVVVIIMLAVATFAGFAREQDSAFEQTSGRLVESAMDARTRALVSVALDYANWDDAYQAISGWWDRAWIESNIYSGVADGMILLRADGRVRYAWFSEAFEGQAEELQRSVADAAVAVPNLRQLARLPTISVTVAHTYAQLDQRLLVVAVAPVTMEDNALRAARTPPYDYLALVDVVDSDELTELGTSIALQDMRFAPGAQPDAGENRTGRMLAAANGRAIGMLAWRHARPGSAAFHQQVWLVIAALISIGALAILIARLLVTRQVQALASASAALESSRAKSEFLARVSDELRTPLNAIIGYSELIQEENESVSTRADAGHIITAARHLGHLLNDIIDQSRIDAGHIKTNPEVLPVAGMLAEVQGLMGALARSGGVTLSISSDPLTGFVYADHVRLRQCLLNMVGNAIKFAPGGEVSVTTRAVVRDDRQLVAFDVTDNGIGIAKAELDKIFRPFGQANAMISRSFGGTGLGLSISRDLALSMGGDLTVVSELGEGSTFSLIVPAATAGALKAA